MRTLALLCLLAAAPRTWAALIERPSSVAFFDPAPAIGWSKPFAEFGRWTRSAHEQPGAEVLLEKHPELTNAFYYIRLDYSTGLSTLSPLAAQLEGRADLKNDLLAFTHLPVAEQARVLEELDAARRSARPQVEARVEAALRAFVRRDQEPEGIDALKERLDDVSSILDKVFQCQYYGGENLQRLAAEAKAKKSALKEEFLRRLLAAGASRLGIAGLEEAEGAPPSPGTFPRELASSRFIRDMLTEKRDLEDTLDSLRPSLLGIPGVRNLAIDTAFSPDAGKLVYSLKVYLDRRVSDRIEEDVDLDLSAEIEERAPGLIERAGYNVHYVPYDDATPEPRLLSPSLSFGLAPDSAYPIEFSEKVPDHERQLLRLALDSDRMRFEAFLAGLNIPVDRFHKVRLLAIHASSDARGIPSFVIDLKGDGSKVHHLKIGVDRETLRLSLAVQRKPTYDN